MTSMVYVPAGMVVSAQTPYQTVVTAGLLGSVDIVAIVSTLPYKGSRANDAVGTPVLEVALVGPLPKLAISSTR